MTIPTSTFLPTQLSLVLAQPKGVGALLQTSGSLVGTDLMCQGAALTEAMRVECPFFRITGTLWRGDKPPQSPGTVPWGGRLVITGWKGPLGLSHLAIPNPSHVSQICRREGEGWSQEGKIPPEEGGGAFFHLKLVLQCDNWSGLPGRKRTTIKGFVSSPSPLLCFSHP